MNNKLDKLADDVLDDCSADTLADNEVDCIRCAQKIMFQLAQGVKDLLAENERWENGCKSRSKEATELKFALQELVSLKHIKDTKGKTKEYLKRQPKAWEQARLLTNKQED